MRASKSLMRRTLSHSLLILLAGAVVGAQQVEAAVRPRPVTSPIFINSDPIVPPQLPPQIDAYIFDNRSIFTAVLPFTAVGAGKGSIIFSPPYQAQNVLFWTNSGVIVGAPGFHFNNIPDVSRLPARLRRRPGANLPKPSVAFYNAGEIDVFSSLTSVDPTLLIISIDSSPSLLINAATVDNAGSLNGDFNSRFLILATNGLADLSRGSIRIGDVIPECSSGFALFDPKIRINYQLPVLIGTNFNDDYRVGFNGVVVNPNANNFNYFTGTNGTLLRLDTLGLSFTNITFTNIFFPSGNFALPNPTPPPHQVIRFLPVIPTTINGPTTRPFTNLVTALRNCGDYDAFMHVQSNFFGRDITVVFVPTNNFPSTNMAVDVRFLSSFGFGGGAIVEWQNNYFDVIEQQERTNYITFLDQGFGFPSGSSPSIFQGRLCDPLFFTEPANTPFTPTVFYNTGFQTNFVRYVYNPLSVDIGNTNAPFFTNNIFNPLVITPTLGRHPALSDPSNYVGRVEVRASNLDLSPARVRAENAISVKTDNLIDTQVSFFDAPIISFDARTTNTDLIITNLVPSQVNRLEGQIDAWTASWTMPVTNGILFSNVVVIGTNIVTNVVFNVEDWNYHVVMLGACFTPMHRPLFHQLALEGTNLVIHDNIAVNGSFVMKGQSLTFGRNASLMLPERTSLAFTNLQRVTFFTNEGLLNIPQGSYFGEFPAGYSQPPLTRRERRLIRQRKLPPPPQLEAYESFVNRGRMNASTHAITSDYFELSGQRFLPTELIATNGAIVVHGSTAVISNAVVDAMGDIRFSSGDLLIWNSILDAGAVTNGSFGLFLPGAIIIDPTNSLTDGGLQSSNQWFATAGVRVMRRPNNPGDLMGTHIISLAGVFAQSLHVWAGENRGAVVEGFTDNLAVGHLTLDGSLGNDFRFRSAGFSNAIYVDFLELVRDATNFSFAIGVDPDFTIYFADSNILPEKIEETSGGRIRWVSQFTGPRSSTNIVYPNGVTYTFNAGVVRSKDRDDDGDGVVNAEDCTPISVSGFDSTLPCPPAPAAAKAGISVQNISLTIALASGGREVVLNWDAAANSANTVEFIDSFADAAAGWQPLTNFINGPVNTRVTVKDAVGGPLRVYRVRVDAGKP